MIIVQEKEGGIYKHLLVQKKVVQGRNGITARFFPLRSVRFLVLRLLDADIVLYLFREDMALFLIGVGKFCR